MNRRYIKIEHICNKDPNRFMEIISKTIEELQTDNHFVEVHYTNDGEYFTALLLQYENVI